MNESSTIESKIESWDGKHGKFAGHNYNSLNELKEANQGGLKVTLVLSNPKVKFVGKLYLAKQMRTSFETYK